MYFWDFANVEYMPRFKCFCQKYVDFTVVALLTQFSQKSTFRPVIVLYTTQFTALRIYIHICLLTYIVKPFLHARSQLKLIEAKKMHFFYQIFFKQKISRKNVTDSTSGLQLMLVINRFPHLISIRLCSKKNPKKNAISESCCCSEAQKCFLQLLATLASYAIKKVKNL